MTTVSGAPPESDTPASATGSRAWLLWLLPLAMLLHGRTATLDLAVSVLVVLAIVAYWGRAEFVALAGFFVAYSPVLFLYDGGPSLVNVYLVAYAARVLSGRVRLRIASIGFGAFVLLAVSAMVLTQYVTALEWLTVLLGGLALWGVLTELRDPDTVALRQQFVRMCVYGGLSAVLYGVLNERVIEASLGLGGLERYLGTQNDPNFMAMLLCACLGFVWSIDAHRFPTKLLMAAGLVAGITLTGSLTGLICTVISLAVYVAMRTARGTTTSSLILAVAALAIVGGTVILMANSGLLPATLQVRFSEASVELTGRDITSLTSGRSDIQGQYLAFWRDQDIFRQLFGGYGVSVLALVGEPFSMIGLATHNTFLDVLFTCGLLGLLLFVVLILTSLRQAVTAFRSQADQVALSFFVAKVVWVLFAFSLSVFPSWTYLLLLLAV